MMSLKTIRNQGEEKAEWPYKTRLVLSKAGCKLGNSEPFSYPKDISC